MVYKFAVIVAPHFDALLPHLTLTLLLPFDKHSIDRKTDGVCKTKYKRRDRVKKRDGPRPVTGSNRGMRAFPPSSEDRWNELPKKAHSSTMERPYQSWIRVHAEAEAVPGQRVSIAMETGALLELFAHNVRVRGSMFEPLPLDTVDRRPSPYTARFRL